MASAKVVLDVDGALATITLNRPQKLNAIDPDMLTQLEIITARLAQADEVRVVLLTGAGDRAFSVGADIDAWSALPPLDVWRWWVRRGHQVFTQVASLRQPVIAVLNGYTFGGGLELALAADLRIAADHAELALPEVSLGTVPGWGGSRRLPAMIGAGRAKHMILTGMRVDAETAERWGLINVVAPGAKVMAVARELAAAIAANAPLSVQIAKQLVDAEDAGVCVTLEAFAGALAATTADGQEGIAAFRERRQPRFHGT